MKGKLRIFFMVFLLIGITCFCTAILAGCVKSGENNPGGETPGGETPGGETPTGLVYTLLQGAEAYSVKGGDNTITSAVIPAEHEGKPVTEIADEAFKNYTALASVTIGSNVTSIGVGAFDGSGLTAVTIPASVTSIGANAFSGCASLAEITVASANTNYSSAEGVLFNKAASNLIFYPAGKTASSYSVPATVQTIVRNAFTNSRFTSLATVAGLGQIEAGAFTNCAALTTVVIADSVTTVASGAFSGCNALTTITLPFTGNIAGSASNTHFGYIFGAETAAQNAAKVPASLRTVTVTKSIGTNAFSNLTNLTAINIGDSVAAIGTYAFENCEGLTSVTIPASVKTIGNNAFSGCSELASVTLNSGIESIGSSAFAGLAELKSIVIPNSVETIDSGAFANTPLESITLPFIGRSATDTANAYLGYIFGATSAAGQNTAIPEGIAITYTAGSIAAEAFKGITKISTVIFSVTEIGASAFEGCSGLTDVVLDGVETIGANAFKGAGLTSLTISSSIISIGVSAFENCAALESVTLPEEVENIADSLFKGCTNLDTIVMPGVTSIGVSAFENAGFVSLNLHTGLQTIGASAFKGNTKLATVVVPSSVSLIGAGAFEDSDAISSITLPFVGKEAGDANAASAFFGYIFGATEIGTGALSGQNTYLPSSPLAVTITGSTISANAFKYCANITAITLSGVEGIIAANTFESCTNLASVVIGTGITEIGANAFVNCTALNNITLPDTVARVGANAFGNTKCATDAENNTVVYAGNWAILAKGAPTSVKDGTIGLAAGLFAGNTDLAVIDIPASLRYIGDAVFSGCTNLANINIDAENIYFKSVDGALFNADATEILVFPKSKTTYELPSTILRIAANTFEDSGLVTFTVSGTNLVEIAANAFLNSTSLTTVTLPKSVTTIGLGAFKGCTSLAELTVPHLGKNSTASQNHILYFFGFAASSQANADNKDMSQVLTAVTITGDLTGALTLAANALRYCKTIQTITITANSIAASMGTYVFAGCTSLTKVIIAAAIAGATPTLGNYAFDGCSKLVTVVLPSNLVNTGTYAFQNCVKLEHVKYATVSGVTINETAGLPTGLKTIGQYAFSGCKVLPSITIPAAVTSIGNYAFSGCEAFTSITINTTAALTTTGTNMFKGCTGLETVTFAGSIATIGTNMFDGCTSLSTVNISSSSITTINAKAFLGCTALTTITLPKTLTTLTDDAFDGAGLTSIDVVAGSTAATVFSVSSNKKVLTSVTKDSGVVTTVKLWLYLDSAATTYAVDLDNSGSNKINAIALGAFSRATSLTNISVPFIGDGSNAVYFGRIFGATSYSTQNSFIPASLKTVTVTGNNEIGMNAFYGCANIKTINFTGNPSNIASNAFTGAGITITTEGYFDYYGGILLGVNEKILDETTVVTTITIKGGVWAIAEKAFTGSALINSVRTYYCASVTKIIIPASVKVISSNVFINDGVGCTNLEEVEVTAGNANFLSENGILYEYEAGGSDKIRLLFVPADLAMTDDVFTVPEGVTVIDNWAFALCTRIKTIKLASTITSLKENTFFNLQGVKVFVDSDINSSLVTINQGGSLSRCVSVFYIKEDAGIPTPNAGCMGGNWDTNEYAPYKLVENTDADAVGYKKYVASVSEW